MILASASPRRQVLLQQIGLTFTTVPSKAEEKVGCAKTPPTQLVVMNALAKAADVVGAVKTDEIVIGADTVVYYDGRIFGKPNDQAEAKSMLKALSGHWHEVYTGIAVIKGNERWTDVEVTAVYLADLTEEQIASYVLSGEPMDKAGAYAIQGLASAFVRRIEGCYSNVVGLPLYSLVQLLKKAGAKLPCMN